MSYYIKNIKYFFYKNYVWADKIKYNLLKGGSSEKISNFTNCCSSRTYY